MLKECKACKSQISPDAKNFCDELSQKTKDNSSANDTALGNINPEKAVNVTESTSQVAI